MRQPNNNIKIKTRPRVTTFFSRCSVFSPYFCKHVEEMTVKIINTCVKFLEVFLGKKAAARLQDSLKLEIPE